MTPLTGISLFSVIFFLSGATSLVYQVAWMRKLSLFLLRCLFGGGPR
jgi:hypothetical protein